MGEKKSDLKLNRGNIPVLFIKGNTIPEAWEKLILGIWDNGVDIRTEYDRKDSSDRYIDPPSKDASVMVEVDDPFAEPRIHKNFPGGPAELEIYRQEVVEGIHDHWVDPSDPDKWTYTYHGRLERFQPTEDLSDPTAALLSARKVSKIINDTIRKPIQTEEQLRGALRELETKINEAVVDPVSQLDYVVRKSAGVPFSRRAMASTWMPTADPQTNDPPCLQYLWFRIMLDEQGQPVLNLDSHWRSRDAYKAWFMNVFAITDLQRVMAKRISQAWSEKEGRPVNVKVGRYMDTSDSLHIYGSYFGEIMPELKKMRDDPDYNKRSWPSDHPAVQMMFEETRARLRADRDFMRSK
jgi:thymidylate synthase